jgi:hypothetical protein
MYTNLLNVEELCILPTQCIYGSHNKQRVFPETALTGWSLCRRNVFPVRYEPNFYICDYITKVCRQKAEVVQNHEMYMCMFVA